MSIFEDLDPWFYFPGIRGKLGVLSKGVWASMASGAACAAEETAEDCRDDAAAMRLKLIAVGVILVTGVAGVALPLVGRKRRFLRTDGGMFVLAKAFAAGVILATGFVHMLHDAQKALTDPCLPDLPWRRFPFSGFIAMLAALGTLLVDFLGTQFYERKHREETMGVKAAAAAAAGATTAPMLREDEDEERGIIVVPMEPATRQDEADGGDKSPMHIIGMRAHAAAHRHSHSHGDGACEGHGLQGHSYAHDHGHAHSHVHGGDTDVPSHVRHVVVSQILELGIVSHSVIIGLSLGVSRSPCTIRPLVAALSFHQFFEGFALGGCVSQAQYKNLAATLMAAFFAVTTPGGIACGMGISSVYNPNSSGALVVEGLLDSVSAGILIYMALVDLIAADFLSRKMSCNVRLQVASYFALFLGAASMSALAIWA